MSKLAELRKQAKLTQQALANKSGIFIRQIQKIESGEADINNITFKNGLALAEALDIDPRELIK